MSWSAARICRRPSLKDIVAAAKANPGSISVATAGVGTGQHLVAAAFMKAAGVKLQEVPYKGSPPAFTDLLAGRIDLFFDSIAAGLPYIQSGQARGIAVLSSKRRPLAPDVPTMSEAGVAGLDVDSWLGIFVPAKTPPEIIAKLRTDIRAVLPDLKERFEKSGGEVWDMPDDKIDAFVAAEYAELDQTDPRGRHQAGLVAGELYFTRSISSIAPAGARILPSWMT